MKKIWILIFAIIILLLSIAFFFVFNSWLGCNHDKWGNFGTYIGGIGGIVLSCSLFYYTYTIDKEHKKTVKNTQVLKLIEVVGESLAYIERWKKHNSTLTTESVFNRGLDDHEKMKNERNQLEIRLWTNYKTTQVLASHLYKMDLPNVAALHETEAHFYKVYEKISPTSDK